MMNGQEKGLFAIFGLGALFNAAARGLPLPNGNLAPTVSGMGGASR